MKLTEETLSSPPPKHSAAIEWLTAAEAARHLKVNPRTLSLWVRQGNVKGYQLSGAKRHVWRELPFHSLRSNAPDMMNRPVPIRPKVPGSGVRNGEPENKKPGPIVPLEKFMCSVNVPFISN